METAPTCGRAVCLLVRLVGSEIMEKWAAEFRDGHWRYAGLRERILPGGPDRDGRILGWREMTEDEAAQIATAEKHFSDPTIH